MTADTDNIFDFISDFFKIPFCIGKEILYVCSNMFFYVHFQTMILQEKLIYVKNATK